MMIQMTMSQSQYFSAKLSKDVKRGNEKKRKIGGICGVAPEGYLNDRINKTVHKDPERFPLIRKAVDLMLTDEYSVQQILNIMNLLEAAEKTIENQLQLDERVDDAKCFIVLPQISFVFH